MVLEELAQWILEFVNWGITILVFMLLVELWRFFNFNGAGSAIGGKLGEPFSKLVERGGLKGDAALTMKRLKNLWRGEQKEEKFELRKYVDLERLERDVQSAEDEQQLQRKVGSDKRTAERDEFRAYSRLKRLSADVKRAGLKPDVQARANKIMDEAEVFNNLVLEKMKEFNDILGRNFQNIGAKKAALLKIIKEAIAAERALVAEIRKLNSLLK